MSDSAFDHILSSIGSLSPAQMRRLLRKLESEITRTGGKRLVRAKAISKPLRPGRPLLMWQAERG